VQKPNLTKTYWTRRKHTSHTDNATDDDQKCLIQQDAILSQCDRSICPSVNRINDKHGNGRRPNFADTAMTDPLGMINFWWWSGSARGFLITFSFSSQLQNAGFLKSFISTSCTIMFGKMTDGDKIMYPHFWDRSDRHPDPKISFESRITFSWNIGIGGGLHSLSAHVNSVAFWPQQHVEPTHLT